MKRLFYLSLLLVLVTTFVSAGWSIVAKFGSAEHDTFTIDAADLTATCVSPHMEARIEDGSNVVWCGTFQLAWNEACTKAGEDLHFAGKEPDAVAALNKKSFRKEDLDEGSYVAVADFARNDFRGRVQSEMARKFAGRARPHLPSLDGSRSQDILTYSYLEKNLDFATPFEHIDDPLVFAGKPVSCFGIGRAYEPGQNAMYDQVRILDYKGPDDFVVELRTKSKGDRLILAKVRPGATLDATVGTVEGRVKAAEPVCAARGDVLIVPKFDFNITQDYKELIGRRLTVANPAVAKDSQIAAAVQGIRFQLNEAGVKLQSESFFSFGPMAAAPPPRKHMMVFDKAFLVLLQRTDAKTPYFAMWVGNAELAMSAGSSPRS